MINLHFMMFPTHLKMAWRNIRRNTFFAAINIGGLAIGLAVAMLIGLWIWEEFSFDKYNRHYDRIAAVMQQSTVNGETGTNYSCPVPLAEELRLNYKKEFKQVVLSWWNREHILAYGDRKFTRIGKFMEPAAPGLMDLTMINGSANALQDPSSVIIAASVATTLFGGDEAMNKVIRIDDRLQVKVTGIYKDIPATSRFKDVMFIAPWQLLASSDELIKNVQNEWGFDAAEIFVQLADNVTMEEASATIRQAKFNKIRNQQELVAYKPQMLLQPMSRWHLYAEWKNGINTGGNIRFVWLFGWIGLFVLLLACINFMNLATARSEKRAKEVGIRKAIGSLKKQLISQFMIESAVMVMLSFLLSLVFMLAALPFYNELAGRKMTTPWTNPLFWLLALSFCGVTAVIAGSYPSFYLSSFKPIKVLKGAFKEGALSALPRKILVVLQFSVSMMLIIGTIVVFRQINYAQHRPVGYNKDGLLQVQMNVPQYEAHLSAIRDELLKSGTVTEVAAASSPATGIWSGRSGFEWQGKDPSLQTEFGAVAVTHNYGKAMGWQFKEGRDFSSAYITDSNALVLNEAAVKFMGLKQPVGETIQWDDEPFTVIGVIKNMVMESPYEPVRQTIYSLKKEKNAFLFLKINPSISAGNALNNIREVLQKYVPAAPFDYKFVDEQFDRKFATEQRIGQLSFFFSVLAIFISCLGLFGMASFMAEQRLKEIGIRKVLGASVFNLWKLLSGDFVILVILSFLIAIPVSWYLMHQWLLNYAYHTSITIWIFIATGVLALIVTLCTVSYQSIKAALINPVKSLRSE